MEMDYKAIFFDIDGTLQTFTNPPTIPESTRLALKELRKNGVKLFIATGRPKKILKEFRDLIDFEFDGWVIMNGQYCFCEDEVIRECTIPVVELEKTFAYLNENNIGCIVAELDEAYQINENERVNKYNNQSGYREVGDISRIYEHPVYQLMVYIEEEEVEIENEFFKNLPSCKSARWTREFMDVIPKEGGKNKGIDAMLEHFNIPLSKTMAFGDGGNDIAMLSYVGMGIAMGNASDKVKAAAKYVTSSIDQNGIYEACIHFGLIKK